MFVWTTCAMEFTKNVFIELADNTKSLCIYIPENTDVVIVLSSSSSISRKVSKGSTTTHHHTKIAELVDCQ